jgi:hypothetical protein
MFGLKALNPRALKRHSLGLDRVSLVGTLVNCWQGSLPVNRKDQSGLKALCAYPHLDVHVLVPFVLHGHCAGSR